MTSPSPLFGLTAAYGDHGELVEEQYAILLADRCTQTSASDNNGRPRYTYATTEPFPDASESGSNHCRTAPGGTNENGLDHFDFQTIGTAPELGFELHTDPSFVFGNEQGLLRGHETHVEAVTNGQSLTTSTADASSRYHDSPPPKSTVTGNLSPSLQTPYFAGNSTSSANRNTQGVAATMFAPYEGKFQDSESAKVFRKIHTRGNRVPYIPPETDSTIVEIEQNRAIHVERIYNAMTRGDKARDNERSIAMKRWVHGAYYRSHLIEAYCHKVLDCLLEQAKKGYRGWEHNDYVADDRKGDDEDRDVDCAARLDNIIRALEEEKTICEDVMNSACQIRMFVNAPKAYANRKYQNRVGNSKRGKPKDVVDEEMARRQSKMRRTPLRPTTRTRTNTHLLARPINQTPQLLQQQPQAQPYLAPPTQAISQSNTMSGGALINRHSATMVPAQLPTFTANALDFASPPSLRTALRPPNSMPSRQQHVSVPGPSGTRISTQVMQPSQGPLETWPSIQAYDRPHELAIPDTEPLFGQDWALHSGDQVNVESANLFDQHPDAASLGLSREAQELGGHEFFQGNWFQEQDTMAFTDHHDPSVQKYDLGE